MARCLIVANRTMGGRKLAAELERIDRDRGPMQFHLVVPEHGLETLDLAWAAGGFGVSFGFGAMIDDAREESHDRMDRVVARLRARGLAVTAEIGPAPPVAAIAKALREQPCDEIVISTLPATFSKWLRMDLPRRVQRKFGVPVTTVVHDDADDEILDLRPEQPTIEQQQAVREVAREHPIGVLVVDQGTAAGVRLRATLSAMGLCAVHVAASGAEAGSYLRGEGRSAGRALPDLVAVAVDSGTPAPPVLAEIAAETERHDRALLVVANRDDQDLRVAADALGAWAFVPLSEDERDDAGLLELMLVELVALGHRQDILQR